MHWHTSKPHQQNVNVVDPPIAIIPKKTHVGNVYAGDWVIGHSVIEPVESTK